MRNMTKALFSSQASCIAHALVQTCIREDLAILEDLLLLVWRLVQRHLGPGTPVESIEHITLHLCPQGGRVLYYLHMCTNGGAHGKGPCYDDEFQGAGSPRHCEVVLYNKQRDGAAAEHLQN